MYGVSVESGRYKRQNENTGKHEDLGTAPSKSEEDAADTCKVYYLVERRVSKMWRKNYQHERHVTKACAEKKSLMDGYNDGDWGEIIPGGRFYGVINTSLPKMESGWY